MNGWLTLIRSTSEAVCFGCPSKARFSWLNAEPEAIASLIISSI